MAPEFICPPFRLTSISQSKFLWEDLIGLGGCCVRPSLSQQTTWFNVAAKRPPMCESRLEADWLPQSVSPHLLHSYAIIPNNFISDFGFIVIFSPFKEGEKQQFLQIGWFNHTNATETLTVPSLSVPTSPSYEYESVMTLRHAEPQESCLSLAEEDSIEWPHHFPWCV